MVDHGWFRAYFNYVVSIVNHDFIMVITEMVVVDAQPLFDYDHLCPYTIGVHGQLWPSTIVQYSSLWFIMDHSLIGHDVYSNYGSPV